MNLDFVLPNWKVPAPEPVAISDAAYLDWLDEERRELIRANGLQRRDDPVRCPVNVRFVWNKSSDTISSPRPVRPPANPILKRD